MGIAEEPVFRIVYECSQCLRGVSTNHGIGIVQCVYECGDSKIRALSDPTQGADRAMSNSSE
jgi:hypothetical protein